MAVTLTDIAEETGVSVSTVSRVLNDKANEYRISQDTRELILRTARRLNYRPNNLARNLRLSRTQSLGLVVPDVANPFFASLTKHVHTVAHELGYSLFVCNTDEDVALEIEHVTLLHRNRVDGLIAMPVGRESAHFKELHRRGIPLVLLDRGFDDLNVSTVLVDNYQGAYDAVAHLIAYGHERIAIVQGLPGTYTAKARLRGYEDALQAHGLPVHPEYVVGRDFRRENGYIETRLLLNLAAPPTAIFATSDLITLGALQAIEEEGLDVPRDVSLISFDDFEFAPFLRCPLTTVGQPKSMMGKMAVKLLVEELAEETVRTPKRIVLKPELIRRGSVATPR